MIFIAISIILLAALVYLTVAASKNPKKLSVYRFINTAVGIFGVLVVIGAYLIGYLLINSAKNDSEWASWAGDMFYIYYDLTLKVFVILFALVVVTILLSISNKKSRGGFFSKVRIITPVAISALLLIITYFYAPATANETLPLHIFIYLSGIGEALAMRLVYALEYTLDIRSKK